MRGKSKTIHYFPIDDIGGAHRFRQCPCNADCYMNGQGERVVVHSFFDGSEKIYVDCREAGVAFSKPRLRKMER
jgi:hypothetical protein